MTGDPITPCISVSSVKLSDSHRPAGTPAPRGPDLQERGLPALRVLVCQAGSLVALPRPRGYRPGQRPYKPRAWGVAGAPGTSLVTPAGRRHPSPLTPHVSETAPVPGRRRPRGEEASPTERAHPEGAAGQAGAQGRVGFQQDPPHTHQLGLELSNHTAGSRHSRAPPSKPRQDPDFSPFPSAELPPDGSASFPNPAFREAVTLKGQNYHPISTAAG